MIGCHKNPTLEFSSFELHGMTWCVGITSPAIAKIKALIRHWLPWSVHLQRNICAWTPGNSVIQRNFVPDFAQPVSFANFSFVIVSCIVKQEDYSIRQIGIGQINYWCRITCLQISVIGNHLHNRPRFTIVAASLHDNVYITEITRIASTALAESEKVSIGQPDNSGYTITFITAFARFENNGLRCLRKYFCENEKCNYRRERF